MSQTRRHRLPVVTKFMSAGAVGVIAYYVTLYTLTDILGIWYIASASIAFIANYGTNFVLQKFWAFKDSSLERVRRQVVSYFSMAGALFLTNLGLLYVQVEYLHLWYLAAQVVNTILLTIISFVVSKRIFAR